MMEFDIVISIPSFSVPMGGLIAVGRHELATGYLIYGMQPCHLSAAAALDVAFITDCHSQLAHEAPHVPQTIGCRAGFYRVAGTQDPAYLYPVLLD